MKNTLLFLFITFTVLRLSAQAEFAPPGAKWTYGYEDYSWQGLIGNGYETIEYTGDSLIEDTNVKILTRTVFSLSNDVIVASVGEKIYIYENQGRIYQWDSILLYDFNLLEGEVAQLPSEDLNNDLQLIITDITTESINDQDLMVFSSIISCPPEVDTPVLFNNRFGAMDNYLFLSEANCIIDSWRFYSFRCYQDDDFGFYQTDTIACDYISGVKPYLSVNSDLIISPNPTSTNQFYLTTDHFPPNAAIHLYSPLGQLLSKEKWVENGQIFPLPGSGVYYITVYAEGKQIAVKRVVGVR